MLLLPALTECPHCHAELPPFTRGCPHCGRGWRELLRDEEFEQERDFGMAAAVVWIVASMLLFPNLTELHAPYGGFMTLATLAGYPALPALLAIYGRSRNRGSAGALGAGVVYVALLLLLAVCLLIAWILAPQSR